MSRTDTLNDKQTDKQIDRKTDRQTKPPVKTAVILSADACHRLKSAALHEGTTQSELVEALILKHLGGYFTSKRATGAGDDQQGTSGGLS